MNRRHAVFAFLTFGAAGLPLVLFAQQQGKVWRVGFLGNSSAALEGNYLDAVRQGLTELGYVEGKNLILKAVWAEGKNENLPQLAADLAKLPVDLIVTGGTPGTIAAHRAATGLPIIMVGVGDPVGSGLITTLAMPGGNVTGLATLASELEGKRIELLREIAPNTARLAVLLNPGNPFSASSYHAIVPAAEKLGLKVERFEARNADELDRAFSALSASPANALIVVADRFLLGHRTRIAEYALARKLPGVFPFPEFAKVGGLLAYSPDYPALYRRAAIFIDKVFKGVKTATLPTEQPIRFEFIVNGKTAKAFGLAIPQTLRLGADEVIE